MKTLTEVIKVCQMPAKLKLNIRHFQHNYGSESINQNNSCLEAV